MKKPKILLLNTYTGGGAAIACYRLGQALEKADCQVSYLTVGPTFDTARSEGLRGIRKLKGRFNFYAERLSFWRKSISREVRFSFSPANVGIDISKHPLVQEADILHLHWINHGFLSPKNLAQLQALGKPIVWTMHDMWPFTGGCHYAAACTNYLETCGNCSNFLSTPASNDLSNKGWQIKKKYYNNIQGVTPSRWLKDCANDSSLMKGTDVICIPNGIDTGVFKPIAKEDARKFHKLPQDKTLILFLAVKITDKRKGFEQLQNALTELRKKEEIDHSNIELVVVGGVGNNTLDMPYKAHYLGHISNQDAIIKAYNAADLFVIPSLEDNLPNTIMESLSCGTPAVGFNTGGIPEMIDHEKNGYIAEFKDAQDLATGISWSLSSAVHLQQLSQAARSKAENHYAEAVVAKQYIDLYNKLIKTT